MRSSSSASTSVSFERRSKRFMLTVPRGEHDLVGLDAGDAAHRHEDPVPLLQLDDQPENARRLPVDAQRGHCVADPAELVAVGIEDADAGEPGEEDPSTPVLIDRGRPLLHICRLVVARVSRRHGGGKLAWACDWLPLRPRRSCLAVPGSNPRFLEKAKGLDADQVFLDLEDACAPLAKPGARKNIVAALNEGGWGDKIRVVRVNDWTTHWTYRDVIEVVEGAGAEPRLHHAAEGAERRSRSSRWTSCSPRSRRRWASRSAGSASRPRSRTPQGLIAVDAIAKASPRVETIIFGPADFMASINMKSLVVGEQPPGYDVGDAYHHILMSILMAARANGKQAIDGPYLQIRDPDGFRRVASRSAALGFDGKWVLHPDQIGIANEVYAPAQDDYDHAELILDAYDYYTSEAGGAKGSAMLGDEMIDEASRKMALVIAAKGRAAGLQRTSTFEPPQS